MFIKRLVLGKTVSYSNIHGMPSILMKVSKFVTVEYQVQS